MAAEDDNIGELLDEVERKYCPSKTTPSFATMVNHRGNQTCSTREVGKAHSTAGAVSSSSVAKEPDISIRNGITEEDFDQIISEIINEPEDEGTHSRIRRGRKVDGTTSSPAVIGRNDVAKK